MPPKDHLLNWGAEILDHHMMLLANPGMLPEHPLLEEDAIIHFIAQEHAQSYEKMLSLLMLQQLKSLDLGYTASNAMESRLPVREVVDITQGVYRIGARQDPRAYDNELPPQMVELSKFAIAKRPVSNAEYLAFMEDGGYNRPELWPADAGAWLQAEANGAPLHWRKDQKGRCYGIGLNGAFELASDDPVYGVNQHEASAFAAWTAQLSDQTAGAVLQHEYQWEVATRTQAISEYGRVWEWCANTFEPYSEYQPPARNHLATQEFDGQHKVLRGASLHSQPVLRRLSFRNRAHPHSNIHFSGIRLVFPPSKDFWLP
jgi:iron(II)-dependent oxidoreductase